MLLAADPTTYDCGTLVNKTVAIATAPNDEGNNALFDCNTATYALWFQDIAIVNLSGILFLHCGPGSSQRDQACVVVVASTPVSESVVVISDCGFFSSSLDLLF